jgi:hypothetical protein
MQRKEKFIPSGTISEHLVGGVTASVGATTANALIATKDAFFAGLFATFIAGFFGRCYGTDILTSGLTGEVDGMPAAGARTATPTGTTCVPILFRCTPPAADAGTGRVVGCAPAVGPAAQDLVVGGMDDLAAAGCVSTTGGLGAAMAAQGGAQRGWNGRGRICAEFSLVPTPCTDEG